MIHPVATSCDLPLPKDGTLSELEDECARYPISETATESDNEGPTSTSSRLLIENLLKEQTEETRINLVEVAEDTEADEVARSFAGTAAEVVELWQKHAKDNNPTSHQVDFGIGLPLNLLMILALLPEEYQFLIRIEDGSRSPSGNGNNLSWLHEQTTDALVRLSTNPEPESMLFGQGLASLIRNDVDEGWRAFTGRTWLEDQVQLLTNGDLETALYRFPHTEKIVFLFNPTGIHWTVVEVNLDEYAWTYTLYNSLPEGERGLTWKACQEQFPFLEQLICRASGFTEPETREIVIGASAKQENIYDCGPIAVYNAIELLEGRRPRTKIDSKDLRLRYLQLILEGLYLSDEDLEPSAFRLHMRKICIDYLI